MTPIQFQPTPEHIDRAADLLESVLLAEPDVHTSLAVSATLATLFDVHPPYEPGAQPTACTDVPATVTEAFAQLRLAAEAATGVQESVRIGLAARELRAALPQAPR